MRALGIGTVAMVGAVVVACGGGGAPPSIVDGTSSPDIPQERMDGGGPDQRYEVVVGDVQGQDVRPEGGIDLARDGAVSEEAGDVAPDTSLCEATPKPFGCPCAHNDDCESGFCVDVDYDRVCTKMCEEETCPQNFICVTFSQTGRDVMFLCMPRFTKLCNPCRTNDDCQAKGGEGFAVCLDYGPSGSFCGAPCGSGCPQGYDCVDVTLADGGTSGQCKKVDGECTCNRYGILAGMSTRCRVTNEFGICEGLRTCTEEGLSDCDAPTPAPEQCDFLDNDCNGLTDDLAAGTQCQVTNDYGTCKGEKKCVGGAEVCLAQTPAPEQCDGLDNDCDGLTDEGFVDTDGDKSPDCLDSDDDGDGVQDEADNCPLLANPDPSDVDGDGKGDACDPDADGDGFPNQVDCAPLDATIYPGATEVCDGLDNNCNDKVDEGLCNDGILCTFDYCDALSKECKHVPDDSQCETPNPCLLGHCVVGTGCTTEPLTGPECEDGDQCTVGDACDNGVCAGVPLPSCCKTAADCDDQNPCTSDLCKTETGECLHDAETLNGTLCDADGNGCTSPDTCQFGQCTAGPSIECPSLGLECYESRCRSDGPNQYACITQAATAGTACDDGNSCTVMDQCDGQGTCVAGPVAPNCCTSSAQCNDQNPCTLDLCEVATGKCKYLPVADGTPCDADASGCTKDDHCVQGTCAPGPAVTCPPSAIACLDNVCQSAGSNNYACVAGRALPWRDLLRRRQRVHDQRPVRWSGELQGDGGPAVLQDGGGLQR